MVASSQRYHWRMSLSLSRTVLGRSRPTTKMTLSSATRSPLSRPRLYPLSLTPTHSEYVSHFDFDSHIIFQLLVLRPHILLFPSASTSRRFSFCILLSSR